MARDSQWLQVLLIIFVMLTVVLGVTTYLFNKEAFEKRNAAVAADAKVQQEVQKTRAVEDKFTTLATYIGHPEWTADKADQFKGQFDEDQKRAGVSTTSGEADQKPAASLGYTQMVAALSKTVDDRTTELKRTSEQLAYEQEMYKIREAAKDASYKAVDDGYTTIKTGLKKTEGDYKIGIETTSQDMKSQVDKIKTITDHANKEALAAQDQAEKERKARQAADIERQKALEEVRRNDRQQMDVASGSITWSSVAEKTVWIDRGRADALQRQTRFTVYSGESSSAATAIRKGTIEVTRIVSDHQAECKVIDDKLSDPIMAGDKIFTAFWSPGQQNHFALSGIMNLDGDGRNQVNAVVGLIRDFGGAVDCYIDEQGHREGQINANTQYVVVGDPPDKSSQEMRDNNAAILRDVDRYKLHTMTLAEFKQKMNYQKSTSVEHFGGGASSADLNRAAAAAKANKAAKPATKAEDKADDPK